MMNIKETQTNPSILDLSHEDLVKEFIDRGEEFPVMRDPYASAYIRQEQKSGLIGIYESTGLTEAWGPDGLPPWSSDIPKNDLSQ